MDSPRGRIYQMNQVANGAPITAEYIQHMDSCLACRGCETVCPSGVPYGRMIEAARSVVEAQRPQSFVARMTKRFIFDFLLESRTALQTAGAGLFLYEASGVQRVLRASGILRLFGNLSNIEALTPAAEVPFFYSHLGTTFEAHGTRKYRVAFLAGCIANIAFSRLNESTVRVLQRNGCEVVIPASQNCCGALHLHSGRRERARDLARNNIDAIPAEDFDAIITNAAGCGSTLKEYDEILEDDPAYHSQAIQFKNNVKDVTEFLASIELNRQMRSLELTVTYQDSCHLAHGQNIKTAPRKLLQSIPGLIFKEMPLADLCCGSAGIYNLVENQMAMELLKNKMNYAAATGASVIATANPGCLLQLRAGARLYGQGQRVVHVVELLDEAYQNPKSLDWFIEHETN